MTKRPKSPGNPKPHLFSVLDELSIVERNGVLFLPCPLDPEVFEEMEAVFAMREPSSISLGGPRVFLEGEVPYVETVSWESLVEHAHVLFPEAVERIRRREVARLYGGPVPEGLDGWPKELGTILFEVLPHFVRIPRWSFQEVNDPRLRIALWLSERVPVSEGFLRWAEKMKSRIPEEERERPKPGTFFGVDGATGFREDLPEGSLWNRMADLLVRRVHREEQARYRRFVRAVEPFLSWPLRVLAVMLMVAVRGTLEVEGFGFFRRPPGREIVVYRRTGPYALKDFFNRLYLFSDCRVAVTTRDLSPVVIEPYKHPLLPRDQAWQRICIRHHVPPRTITGATLIQGLEEGLKALFYGYDPRKRNGYHSLDHFSSFDRTIDFEDLRIPSDDPRIVSGAVPVTNAFR